VDLPTYTNIWRIEKRLYKLYDFRLPMPLPINWIAVFTGITVPYIVLLIAIGLPFNHTLLWLYVLPPGLLTWLTTRPVLESKRLPELIESQARYLTEPRTWVRLVPLSEKDQMVVTARVWRGRQAPQRSGAMAPSATAASMAATVKAGLARDAVARNGRARDGVPAAALTAAATATAAPVAVRERDRGQPSGRAPRPARNTRGAAPGKPMRSKILALGSGGGRPAPALPAPVLPTARTGPLTMPRSAPSFTPTPPSPAQPPAVVPGMIEGAPVRVRGGAPHPEVSHDRPGQRRTPAGPSVPPATAAPVMNFATTTWPSPPRPLRPVRSAPDERPTSDERPTPDERPAPDETASPVPDARPEEPEVPAIPEPAAAAPVVEAEPDEVVVEDQPAPVVKDAEPAPVGEAAEPVAVVEDAEPAWVREAAPALLEEATEAAPAWQAVEPPVAVAEVEEAEPAPVTQEPAPVDRARLEHSHEPVPAPAFASAPPQAPGPAPAVAVNEAQNRAVPSIERALSGPSREQNPSWHGKVKIVTGTGASHGPGARDQEALDRSRARLPMAEPKRILVLGCTGGAGQTVTALMVGAMLASLREQPVAAVDLHDGTLARYRAPAAWLDEILAGRPPEPVLQNRPDGLNPTPKPSPARLDVIASHQQLQDGDEIKLAVQLNRHYPLTMLDPGPQGLTKLLKVADELVVVVPANAEAAGALADTRDWLDNNGYAELAMRSVTVINGVSRRSLPDVEHAESIARGRSRAIVRVPWDDMLPVAATGPSTLRPQTRVAYTALAGVLVAGLAAAGLRKKQ
jgi:MinD-like ATPase involved in chromosome partitioning or flagellar assembly